MKKLILLSHLVFVVFISYAQIPNSDFENWSTTSLTVPTGWNFFGNVTQVPGASGNYAAKIERSLSDPQSPGAILMGIPDNGNFYGGMPINVQADSIVGKFKYDIIPGDTAWVLVIFKYQGTPIAFDVNLIMGSHTSGFTRLAFKNHFMSMQVPDSVIVGVTSSNPNDPTHPLGGYMIVDDLRFTDVSGNVYAITNGDFESWQTLSNEEPNSWLTSNRNYLTEPQYPVTKTTDSYSGNYAIRLENITTALGYGMAYALAGPMGDSGPVPGFPMTSRDTTFNGYYKYIPQGDTMTMGIMMFYQGAQVGWGFFQDSNPATSYTYFSTNVYYDFSFSGTPDSATVMLLPFQGGSNPHGNSVLYVDKLGLNEQTPTIVNSNIDNSIHLLAYPNPATEYTNICYNLKENSPILINLYDLTGKLIETISNKNESAGAHILRYDTRNLSNGIYSISVEANGKKYLYKISVQR